MEKISVILTDLDGTLFRDDKSISERTVRTVEQARKKGILVGVSTARAVVNVKDSLGDFKPDFFIANGGALVAMDGKQIYTCEFTEEETRRMIAKAYEICGDDVEITMDNAAALYWNRTAEERTGSKSIFAVYTDFRNLNERAMKICVQTVDKKKAEEIASCIGMENVDMQPFSDIPWYKFSRKGATKERAIQALSEYLGVPAANMAAFGDDFSDIGMLSLCGRGIAMENAIPQVKAVADEITLSNMDDGVAFWIEKNLLQDNPVR